jgi:orotidine-5'-phosphate decarboxylase
MKKKIFIACDTTKISTVNKIIKNTQTKELEIGYKFGLEFFNSNNGRKYISKINKNKKIFLDLKLLDIPNTVSAAIHSLSDLKNINYLTIHASGGIEMMKSAKKAAKKINKNLKILGVTVLTSFSEKSLKSIGHTKSIKNLVLHQAKIAKKAGLDGIVCSGHELKIIKKACKNMEIITPGIRLTGDKTQDQKRVMSPNQSFKNGATGLVIGRSLTRGNIKKNIEKLIQELK